MKCKSVKIIYSPHLHMDMETRKIQVTGKSTYVVSLPKKWVLKVNIRNGDSVALLPLPDGTLLINPHITNKDKGHTKKAIQIEDDIEQLQRSFIASYLAGYNVFEFRSRVPLDKEIRNSIRKICKSVIGPEIVEEGENLVVARNLLDSTDFTFSKGIRRMHAIAHDMHSMAIEVIRTGRQELAEEVKQRDDEVDKLYWMIARQYNNVLRDVSLSDRIGIRPQEALGYLLVAKSFERIADHATRIASISNGKRWTSDVIQKVTESSGKIMALMDDAANSFFKAKSDNAYNVVNYGHEMQSMTERLTQEIVSMNDTSQVSVALTFIVDSLERTRAYSVDIAEIAINHFFSVQFNEDLMNLRESLVE